MTRDFTDDTRTQAVNNGRSLYLRVKQSPDTSRSRGDAGALVDKSIVHKHRNQTADYGTYTRAPVYPLCPFPIRF
jgi:hypothetical protein